MLPVAVFAVVVAFAQTIHQDGEKYVLTPEAIMLRVAQNQDRDELLRKEYIARSTFTSLPARQTAN